MDKNSSSPWPSRYRIQFIEPGICSYDDVNDGKVFVSKEALDRMMNSFIGKPVILCSDGKHKDLSAEQAFKLTDEELESLADGIVYGVGWLDNGWGFADCMVWDLDAKEKIKQGISASCSYIPTKAGDAGVWHAIQYDAEVVDGYYKHMALVPNPRYEGAKIWEIPTEMKNSISEEITKIYQNSKESKKDMAFKIFNFLKQKNNANADAPVEENVDLAQTFIVIDGKEVPMEEVIATYKAEMAEKEAMAQQQQASKKNVVNPDDLVDVDGKKVPAKEMAACYSKNMSRQNAGQETEEEKKAKEKKEADDKAAAEAKSKDNSAHFAKLDNALRNGDSQFKMVIKTEAQRLKDGAAKYGSKKDGK
jgi:hypothetical protein